MLRVEHLAKKLEGKVVLEDVDLEIRDREVLTVVGMSGCGKSVLLKLLIGLLSADRGRIWLEGEEISRYTEREYNLRVRGRMSMVFQSGALWDSLTVEENVGLALSLRGTSPPRSAAGWSRRAWTGWACARRPGPTRGSSAAGWPSGRPSPGPSPPGRGSCSTTSRPPGWTRC